VEGNASPTDSPTIAEAVALLASQAVRAQAAAARPDQTPAIEQATPPDPPAEKPVATQTTSPAATEPATEPKASALLSQTTASEAVSTSVPAAPPAMPPAQPLGEAFARCVERSGQLLAAGRKLEARALLSRLYANSRGEAAAKLRALLDRINAELVFTPRCVEGATVHVVEAGEVGLTIGRKYGVPWAMIKRINGMQSDSLSIGQRLKIIQGPATILACKSEFRLALFLDGVYVKEYPIGIGRENLTPSGAYEVDSMLVRPRWYTPGGGYIEYGEEGHQLGDRWIGFRDEPGANGLGIHGTNDEATIGTKCSNGCLRMKNADVIEIYDFVSVGSQVQIIE
jgi:lipoprotein-anchoring transpeptidase ErfK/SrfK